MANDPCNLIPDSVIPAGTPLHPQHAIHHVVGRIRHRVRPKLFHGKAAHAHAVSPEGCEGHAKLGASLLRAAPTGPALAAISGAGGAAIGGFGGYVAGRESKEHKHRHDPGRTPVPEPGSVILLASAVLIWLFARHFCGRGGVRRGVRR